MTVPESDRLFDAFDATWPPKRRLQVGPFLVRDGADGGKRVSAATSLRAGTRDEIDVAVRKMRAFGQTPLFMIRRHDEALDADLGAAGFQTVDPVIGYVIPTSDLSQLPSRRLGSIPCSAPLAVQFELWANGGIGPARLQVMARADNPKTYLLGRDGDRPAATAFVAIHGRIAVLHALEVQERARRKGVARHLIIGAAKWAQDQGARHLAALVTRANAPANALYTSLGMSPVEGYHYRIAPDWMRT